MAGLGPSLGAAPGALGLAAVSLGALLALAVSTWHQCRISAHSGDLMDPCAAPRGGPRRHPTQWLGCRPLRTGALGGGGGSFHGGDPARTRLGPGVQQLGTGLRPPGTVGGGGGPVSAGHRQFNPDDAGAHINLGAALAAQGRFEEAATHYAESIRLDPLSPEAYNNRAMLLATCPEAKYRDGQKAIEAATRACELTEWKMPSCLDTLAAAYAEAGDFDAAVRWQMRATESLRDERAKADYRSRLAIYRAKGPSRMAFPGHSGPE